MTLSRMGGEEVCMCSGEQGANEVVTEKERKSSIFNLQNGKSMDNAEKIKKQRDKCVTYRHQDELPVS